LLLRHYWGLLVAVVLVWVLVWVLVRAPDPENYILAPEKNIFAVLNPEKNILYNKTRLWIVSSLSSSLDQSLTEK